VRTMPDRCARSACQGGRGRPTPISGGRAMEPRCPARGRRLARHALPSLNAGCGSSAIRALCGGAAP
jgi:hypothetical protein